MLSTRSKRIIAALLAALLTLSLASCAEPPKPEPEYCVNRPASLSTGSDYPGVTFNETVLAFVEELITDSCFSVYSSADDKSYTVACDSLKGTLESESDNYLQFQVLSTVLDEWQIESWSYIGDGPKFQSVQPQVRFESLDGNQSVTFWLDSKFAAVYNNTAYYIFNITENVANVVRAQFNELPTRTTELLSPEQTVAKFFEYMNACDGEGVNSLLAKPLDEPYFTPGIADANDYITDIGHIGEFPSSWYENPYANRVVITKFKRTYKDKQGSLIWEFYLVRDSAQDSWKIAAYGGK